MKRSEAAHVVEAMVTMTMMQVASWKAFPDPAGAQTTVILSRTIQPRAYITGYVCHPSNLENFGNMAQMMV